MTLQAVHEHCSPKQVAEDTGWAHICGRCNTRHGHSRIGPRELTMEMCPKCSGTLSEKAGFTGSVKRNRLTYKDRDLMGFK